MRLMGIDYGSKKVGVALSDTEGRMAFPHAVIPNDPALTTAISDMLKREGIGMVVIGESRDYKGAPNPIMSKVRAFAEELSGASGVEVVFEPETLTTKEAERLQGPSELTDASAAALILQSYLDRHGTA